MDIKPMLVSEYPGYKTHVDKQKYVYIQPKLDGWRAIYDKRTNKLFTRTGNEITNLPHINAAMKKACRFITARYIDGELYYQGATADTINAGISKSDTQIQFHIFDFVLSNKSYSERQKYFKFIFESEYVKIIKSKIVSPSAIQSIYEQYLHAGYEGAIVRIDGVQYEQKRSFNIIKIKPNYDNY